MATVERAAPAVASGTGSRGRAAIAAIAPARAGGLALPDPDADHPCGGRRLAAAQDDLVRLHRRHARQSRRGQVHRLPQLSRICRLRRRHRRVVRAPRRSRRGGTRCCNTIWFTVISVVCETDPRHGRGAGAQRQVPGPRPDPRRHPDPLGDPDHRLGEDVGLDAQRPVRHHQRHPARLDIIGAPIAWTADVEHGDDRRRSSSTSGRRRRSWRS